MAPVRRRGSPPECHPARGRLRRAARRHDDRRRLRPDRLPRCPDPLPLAVPAALARARHRCLRPPPCARRDEHRATPDWLPDLVGRALARLSDLAGRDVPLARDRDRRPPRLDGLLSRQPAQLLSPRPCSSAWPDRLHAQAPGSPLPAQPSSLPRSAPPGTGRDRFSTVGRAAPGHRSLSSAAHGAS